MTSGFGSRSREGTRSREGGRRGWDFVVGALRDLSSAARLQASCGILALEDRDAFGVNSLTETEGSMTQAAVIETLTVEKYELMTMLQEAVREVVRDELARWAAGVVSKGWDIEEGSVLWEDLQALKEEFRDGRPQLFSHSEVFGP